MESKELQEFYNMVGVYGGVILLSLLLLIVVGSFALLIKSRFNRKSEEARELKETNKEYGKKERQNGHFKGSQNHW